MEKLGVNMIRMHGMIFSKFNKMSVKSRES